MNIPYQFKRAKSHYRKFGVEGLKFLYNRMQKKNQPLEITLAGLHKPLILRNNTTDIPTFYHVFSQKEYEMDYHLDPEVIVDCGANTGLVSLFYKKKFPKATIIAIEPEPTNFDLLKQNTAAYEDIHCLNCGIWNKTAFLEIHDHGLGKWGFMTEEVADETEHTIRAISIEQIMQQFKLSKIDILKIDIEGSEKEMFEKSYEKWLPHVKVIVIELHDNMRPGCAQAFFKAMSGYEFTLELHGHNIACFMQETQHGNHALST